MRLSSLLMILLFLNFPVQSTAQDVPSDLTFKEIFHEPVLPGIRPSLRSFTANQDSIYISWNDSAHFDTGLYKLSINGSEPEKAEDVQSFVFSPNNKHVAYTKDGDIYISRADRSGERKIVASKEVDGSPTWSPNGRWIAFTRSGDVWVANIARTELIQVTKKEEDDPNFSIRSWAGNHKLVVSQTDYSDARTIYFPEYEDEFVEPGESTRGIPAVSFYTVHLNGADMDTLLTGINRSSTDASATGRYIAVDYSDAPLKERRITIHDTHQGTESVLFEDTTDGWFHETSLSFAPRTEQLIFTSEQSGWNHLYLSDLQSSEVTQITSGDYEITWWSWIDDETILYANNEADYGERHLFRHNLQSGSKEQLTNEEAYRYQFSLNPERTKVVYAKTYFNQPYDLFMIDLENPGKEVQLTQSVPDQFYEINWQEEEYVRFTGRDDETDLSMSVLYPADYDQSKTYPVVVFAHGAGSLQNVYKGWSNNYWREYMFHQYLNMQGYIVVEVDFRHSTGYGRKFREDVTNWMGKYETIDIVDGLDWLQEQEGTLDLDNVGIYGGSYGGFMGLYAVSDMPDRFHAAAALRKVSNWRNYYYANPWYTLPRLGDPEEVPEHYDRSSPLTYASELERPVILLHGLKDDNVGSQDAFQYAEELIQSGNTNFEMMIYPSERHGFTSPDSWYDEYVRIYNFFEEHLK